ncbi:MAG: class GN sortase [Gammaproteobacteria bacterium]
MRVLKLCVLAALAFGAWQWGQAATVQAKAWLAPILIARAWTDSQVHDVDVKPWPWADTWPVAKLTVPTLGIEQYVLAGANGAALPFGPGHMSGTSLPGQRGTIVIAGHRDTHFAFAQNLQPGTKIILESRGRQRSFYRVMRKSIVDARTQQLAVDSGQDELILVTCEPTSTFSARGPYRLVVSAAADGRAQDFSIY